MLQFYKPICKTSSRTLTRCELKRVWRVKENWDFHLLRDKARIGELRCRRRLFVEAIEIINSRSSQKEVFLYDRRQLNIIGNSNVANNLMEYSDREWKVKS